MSSLIQSRFVTLKTTLLVGVLIATPVGALAAHVESTSAASNDDICVTAALKANPSIISHYGDCFKAPIEVVIEKILPEPVATITPEPEPEPTFVVIPEPVATATPEPTSIPAPPEPTASPTPTVVPIPSPDPTPTVTPEPVAPSVPTPTPTPTPHPTPTPDVTVSPTPTPTAPVVPPAPDPIPIPAANTNPKTKSFMFCHGGAMHSNSFSGMLNGHHDRHADDIIPPIPFKFYGGWNWTATNAKTYYNNCIPVK